MSTVATHSPANQDRPLLLHPPRRSSSDQRRIRTLLDLLTIEKMDGVDRTTMRQGEGSNNNNISRWKTFRERLGLNSIGCCGIATWRFESNNSSSTPEVINNNAVINHTTTTTTNNNNNSNSVNNDVVLQEGGEVDEGPTMMNMNLAAALAAERQYRAVESTGGGGGYDDGGGGGGGGDATPSRVSLMRLLEETSDGCDTEREGRSSSSNGGGGESSDRVCCVCMGREKGAAFIPCGHTYCRVCSRELWLNRGSCPLCNRHIHQILDIF